MPRRTRAEEKRTLIRQGAYRCFRDFGYHDTTVDAVCQRVGISKGSFYWHYESKQEVFIDILETWTREVMDELYDRFESTVVDEDYLHAITDALQRELKRGRAIAPLWFEFTVQARRDRQIQDALSKFYRRARTGIAEILRPVMEPRFTESELQSAAATIFGAYAGLMMQEVSDPDRADARKSMTQFMNVVGQVLTDGGETRVHGGPALPPRDHIPDAPPPMSPEVELLLEPFEPEVIELTHRMRRLILDGGPPLSERVITGWKVIAFKHQRDVCSIKPLTGGVRLTLQDGVDLEDPEAMLSGSGKRSRQLFLPTRTPLPTKALRGLLRQAVALQVDR